MWMRDEHNVWSELLSHRVRELCEWEMNTMYGVNYYHIEWIIITSKRIMWNERWTQCMEWIIIT